MRALLDIIINLENLIIWRASSTLCSLIHSMNYRVELWIIRSRWPFFMCSLGSTLNVIPIDALWNLRLRSLTVFSILIRLSHYFHPSLSIGVLLNSWVRVWVFESAVQSYLCWLWSLFCLLLNRLEITIHRSPSWFELLQGFNLTHFLLEMLLFTKNTLFTWIGCTGWTFISEGPNHIMRGLVESAFLLVCHVWLIGSCHHGSRRSNAHLI